jgi:hypothetical protein
MSKLWVFTYLQQQLPIHGPQHLFCCTQSVLNILWTETIHTFCTGRSGVVWCSVDAFGCWPRECMSDGTSSILFLSSMYQTVCPTLCLTLRVVSKPGCIFPYSSCDINAGFGTLNIHKVCVHRTINSTTTQAGWRTYSPRGIHEHKEVN